MTTKDLMIGDYVTFKECQNDDAPAIVKIEGLGYQGRGVVDEALVTIDEDENCFDLVEIDEEFVGIPLTPEILEKNGVKHRATYTRPYFDYEPTDEELAEAKKNFPFSHYESENLAIGVSFYPHCTRLQVFGDNHNVEIEIRKSVIYVHQLQHVLRLAGINKEIVL